MQTTTRAGIAALLKVDPDVTAAQEMKVLNACNSGRRVTRNLVTRKQAAATLGLHPETISRYVKKGALRAIRTSRRRIRYDLEEVEALAREGLSNES